ncbi:hypothetical protein EBU71_19665, partial [bacterium]|nr:hypothetical protein [Candidatus Elulimicrobium humile]
NALDLNNIDNLDLSGVDINLTNGNVTSNYPIIGSNLVYNSGNQTINGIKNFTSRPRVNNVEVLLVGEAAGGADPRIDTLSGNLISTGSTLQTNINNLSNTYATITNLASTGSTLQANINSLSGNSVLIYGNQAIDGTKTFNSSLTLNQGASFNGAKITNVIPDTVNITSSTSINSTNYSNYNSDIILANSVSAITITFGTGIPAGFNSSIIQQGAGQVTITGDTNVTLNSYNNQYKTIGQYAAVSVLSLGNNAFIMYGNTTL